MFTSSIQKINFGIRLVNEHRKSPVSRDLRLPYPTSGRSGKFTSCVPITNWYLEFNRRVVLGDALTVFVQHTEGKPRPLISLLNQRLQKLKDFLVIARLVNSKRILKIPRHHRRGDQHECGQGGEESAHRRLTL